MGNILSECCREINIQRDIVTTSETQKKIEAKENKLFIRTISDDESLYNSKNFPTNQIKVRFSPPGNNPININFQEETNRNLDLLLHANIENPDEIIEKLTSNEDYIAINQDKTKTLFKDKILNKAYGHELDESRKALSSYDRIVKEKFLSTNNLSPSMILKQNTVEFTVCAVNECFKSELNQELVISNKSYNDSAHKYFLNNLISPFETEENPITVLKLGDTAKYNFENLKANKNLTAEFCSKVETLFKQKFQNKYTFEILTIKKGSKELLINTNLPPELYEEFVSYINKNAENDLGAAQEVKQQKNLKELKFTADMIDTRGNMDFTNLGETQSRGRMPYYQPRGWIRIGLRVKGKYGENDNWLAMDGNPGEWAVGFHGLRDIAKTNLIAHGNLLSKDDPKFKHYCQFNPNLNLNTKSKYPQCGKGVYFGDKIEVCELNGFTGSCKFGQKTVKLGFQCRLNPEEIRITGYSPSQAYVVPNQRNDNYDNIRPYGILLKISN